MIRYFLVMAVTGTSLLVADFVLGFFATGEAHGPGAIARGIHLLFSLATVVILLGIHSIVYTYFVATGKWAKEVVHAYQLPDWIGTQAKKNKRRAFRFIMRSMTAIAIAAWLGAAADTARPGLHALAPRRSRIRRRFQYRFVRDRVCRDRRARAASDRAQRPRRPHARRAIRPGAGARRRAEDATGLARDRLARAAPLR